MNDSIIFNWPSGAGGDFLLSIAHLVKRNGIIPIYYIDVNSFNANDHDEDTNIIRGFSSGKLQDYEANKYGKLIHSHQIQDIVPENITIINIDNTDAEHVTSILYLLKSNSTEDALDIPFVYIDCSIHYKRLFSNRTNFFNYHYNDIFVNQDKHILIDMYAKLGVDIRSDYDIIAKIIETYNDINQTMLKRVTIRELYDAQRIRKNKGYDCHSLEELLELLTSRKNR